MSSEAFKIIKSEEETIYNPSPVNEADKRAADERAKAQEKSSSEVTAFSTQGMQDSLNRLENSQKDIETEPVLSLEEAIARVPDDFDASVLSDETLMYLSWNTSDYQDRQLFVGLSECGVEIDLEQTIRLPIVTATQEVHGEKKKVRLTIPEAITLLRTYVERGKRV